MGCSDAVTLPSFQILALCCHWKYYRANYFAMLVDDLTPRARKRILSDWKIYAGVFAYMGVVNTGYAGSVSIMMGFEAILDLRLTCQFFIPTILNQMGYKAAEAQVRTIPIFVVATVVCLAAAYLADRLKHRYTFAMCGLAVASVGYSILLGQQHLSVGVKYFALFLVSSGGFITQPITIGWLANNVSGHYKRSISAAIQLGFGNSKSDLLPSPLSP